MRKVWVTIITYNNESCLNENVESLLNSDLVNSGKYDWYIEIINNHSNFNLWPEFTNRVVVHHQTLRPDWDPNGYFTRDCNSALVRSIKDLNNPSNDQIIILQDDVIVRPDFMEKLVDRHNSGIEFIMSGIGDALNSWLPSAVKKIGLYDERFHTGFHEGDYILRSIQKLGLQCSIGDIAHGRTWNMTDVGKFHISNNQGDRDTPDASDPINRTRAESDLVICPPFTQIQLENVQYRKGTVWHLPVWEAKWGKENTFYNWTEEFKHNVIPTLKQKMPNFIRYPYFEKDIDGLMQEVYELKIPDLYHPDGTPVILHRPLYIDIINRTFDSRWNS